MLHPARAAETEGFLAGYLAVRHAEGRGHDDPAWYLALPTTTPDDPMREQWRMRAVSWRHLVRRVIEPCAADVRRPLRILDIGAGTGWMSRQFRSRGDEPISIDVNVDAHDGLGAAHHLDPDWPVVQAHFDHLPLADAQADLCIFNASLPYTADLTTTLAEAVRVLRPDGIIAVMDSPVYRREVDGRRMVVERHADFERRFGTRSDAVAAIEFLTPDRLLSAGDALGLTWSSSTPWYGLQWAARPLVARLRRRRRPGRFVVLTAQRRSSSIMK
jgi:SAM-dependent methyltransferase